MKLTKTKLDKLIKEQMVKLTEAGEVIDLDAAREEKEDEEERQGLLQIARSLSKVDRYMGVVIELIEETNKEIESSKFYSLYRTRYMGEIEAMNLLGELMEQWVQDIYPRDPDAIGAREELASESWVRTKEEERHLY